MPDLMTYFNRVGTYAPDKFGLERRGGSRAVYPLHIGINTATGAASLSDAVEITEAIKDICGYTTIHEDGIRLKRTLPKRHPILRHLFAERLAEGQGFGLFTSANPTVSNGSTESFDQFSLYPGYLLNFEFTNRPYALAIDDEIETATLTWTKPDGSTVANLNYAKEWYRYTDIQFTPAAEYIEAQAGQFLFDVASGQSPNALSAGVGQLKMLVQKNALVVTWFEVPYKFIDQWGVDSYIEQAIGFVNQNSFLGRDAGTLLLFGVNVDRYPQMIPEEEHWLDSANIFTHEKLCDIKFLFLLKNPVLGKDAAGNTATPAAATNANVIQAGHNLQPFAHTGEWYFAKTVNISGFANASNRGVYPSFPMELCFTNPGVT